MTKKRGKEPTPDWTDLDAANVEINRLVDLLVTIENTARMKGVGTDEVRLKHILWLTSQRKAQH